jgi:hypothetical protein
MDTSVSKNIKCPTCGRKRKLLSAKEWTILPDNSRDQHTHLMAAPVQRSTRPLSFKTEALVFSAKYQVLR